MRGAVFISASPSVRSGYVAAKRHARGPPSAPATTSARSAPAASSTARQVVHALLDRRQPPIAQAVGETHAAAVEADRTTECRVPRFHRSDRRREPESETEDVRPDAEHVDAARAVAVDPVGDVVFAVARISDLAGHRKPLTRITSVLVAGNWKMFKGPAETVAFLEAFEPPAGVEAVVCPPFTSLAAAVRPRGAGLRPERPLGRRGRVHGRDLGADAARARGRGGDRRALRAAPALRRDGRHGARPVRGGARAPGCGSSPASARPRPSARRGRPTPCCGARSPRSRGTTRS